MIFDYPSTPHVRKHGPTGYTSYHSYKPWLRDEFLFRCVYCLTREVWLPSGQASFSADHVVPQVAASDKILDYDNMVYACVRCNSWKQGHIVLDPCQIAFGISLCVKEDGTIEALTPEAMEHVQILGLDDPALTNYRRKLLNLLRRLQDLPDQGSQAQLRQWLSFPDNLPNLATLRPPGGNIRPDGIASCCYTQRLAGTLPEVY